MVIPFALSGVNLAVRELIRQIRHTQVMARMAQLRQEARNGNGT